jgi:hypothetical protein
VSNSICLQYPSLITSGKSNLKITSGGSVVGVSSGSSPFTSGPCYSAGSKTRIHYLENLSSKGVAWINNVECDLDYITITSYRKINPSKVEVVVDESNSDIGEEYHISVSYRPWGTGG